MAKRLHGKCRASHSAARQSSTFARAQAALLHACHGTLSQVTPSAACTSTPTPHPRRHRAGQEGVIGMHGGLPPSDVFPLTAVEYTFRAPPSPPSPTPNGTATATNGVSPPRNGAATASSARVDDPATLAALQQYNLNFDGFAPLREWLAGLMSTMQAPVHPDWGVLLANGALHSIELVLRTFLEPGDTVYVEEFAFSQVRWCNSGQWYVCFAASGLLWVRRRTREASGWRTLCARAQVLEGLMAPMGLRCVGVRMDGEGAPRSVRNTLLPRLPAAHCAAVDRSNGMRRRATAHTHDAVP